MPQATEEADKYVFIHASDAADTGPILAILNIWGWDTSLKVPFYNIYIYLDQRSLIM